jgi:hypothetical protein
VRKSWTWSLITVAGAGVAAAMLSGPEGSSSAGSSSGAPLEPHGRAQVDRRAAAAPPLALPQRPGIGGLRADLFAPPPPPPPSPAAASPQTAAPVAPPNPYRFAGTARFGDSLQILLARGDAVVEASEGEMLDELYRVRTATDEGVTLIYVPLGIEQPIQPSVTPPMIRPEPAPPAGPAQPAQTPPPAAR